MSACSGIFKLDLKPGKLIKRYVLTNQPDKHNPGDLTLVLSARLFESTKLLDGSITTVIIERRKPVGAMILCQVATNIIKVHDGHQQRCSLVNQAQAQIVRPNFSR